MYIVIGGIGLAVIFAIVWVKISMDEKKGENSEEKRMIREIVTGAVPEGASYTAAYGTREEFSLGGGGRTVTTTTTYSYYAVAFKPGDLYLVPLSFQGGQINHSVPLHFGKDELGMLEAKKCRLTLYDKYKKELFTLFVVASNTKEDKFHPVNIQQKEEAEAFEQFARAYMQEINAAAGVTDVKAAKKG